MSKTALPTATDVVNFLASLVTQALPTGIIVPPAFDTASEVAAAIEEWNGLTRYRPFFQTSMTPVAVSYDPPGPNNRGIIRGGGTRLLLRNGLLSLTSLFASVNAPSGSSGVQLVLNQDFFLYPAEAMTGTVQIPYTRIDFSYPQRDVPQSLVITGVWGFCQGTIPDDAWTAIRDLAVARVLEDLREAILAIPTSISELDVRVSYDPALLMKYGTDARNRANAVLTRYCLMSGGL